MTYDVQRRISQHRKCSILILRFPSHNTLLSAQAVNLLLDNAADAAALASVGSAVLFLAKAAVAALAAGACAYLVRVLTYFIIYLTIFLFYYLFKVR